MSPDELVLFRAHPDPMWMYDVESQALLAVNAAAAAFYGYPPDELLTMAAADLAADGRHPEDSSRHRRQDGSVVPVSVAASAVRFQGRAARLAVVRPRAEGAGSDRIRQLEEQLRRREAQLEEAWRLGVVGRLTGGVAHDFNNLLTVMLGNADLLMDQLAGDERLYRLAETTRAAAERGAGLTHRLLGLARGPARAPRPTDVEAVLGGLRGLLGRTLGEHVELELRGSEDAWEAMVDAAGLETAVMALCIDARDDMAQGARLRLETRNVPAGGADAAHLGLAAGDYVAITVSTTPAGAGAPSRTPGTSLADEFAEQSGGRLAVASAPGVRATLYLPRAAAAGAPACGSSCSPTRSGPGG